MRNHLNKGIRAKHSHSFCRYYIPDEQFVTFRYSGSSSQAATGSYFLYQFRGNSLYDPDYTSAGAQPVGFDQWSALYTRYRVYEYTMKVRLSSNTAANNVRLAVWSSPSGSGGAPAVPSYDDAAGNRFVAKTTAASGGPSSTVTSTVDVARLWGTAQGAAEFDDNFSAGVSTNPNRVCWVSLVFDTSTTTGSFTFDWELSMKTRLYQPAQLGLSITARHKRAIEAAVAPTGETSDDPDENRPAMPAEATPAAPDDSGAKKAVTSTRCACGKD